MEAALNFVKGIISIEGIALIFSGIAIVISLAQFFQNKTEVEERLQFTHLTNWKKVFSRERDIKSLYSKQERNIASLENQIMIRRNGTMQH